MSDDDGRRIAEIIIPPEQAKLIVAASNEAGYNFRLQTGRSSYAQRLAEDMRSGAWRWEQATPIRLSDDGTLCSDGLNRLAACAASGVPLRTLVLYGSKWQAGVHTDRGTRRTLTQFLTHEGITNAAPKSGVVHVHMARVIGAARDVTEGYARRVLVHEEDLIKYVVANDAGLNHVVNQRTAAAARGLNGTGWGVFMWEARMVDAGMAEQMHSDWLDGLSEPEDPVTVMRRWTMMRFEKTGRRLTAETTLKNLIKVWAHRLNGDTLKIWRQAAWSDIRFPEGWTGEA